MPLSVEQIAFLTQHLGVAIPPDYVENKKREAEFKQRRAKFDAEHSDLTGVFAAAEVRAALKKADDFAKAGKNFAEALEELENAEELVTLPPPPSEPAPQPPVGAEQKAVAADQPPLPPKDKEEDEGPEAEAPDVPPPDYPAPKPLPGDPSDAIQAVNAQSRTNQEVLRQGVAELLVLQGKYIDLQEARRAVANPGGEFDKLTAEMAQLAEDVKAINVRSGRALGELTRLEQELKQVDVAAVGTPPLAVKAHAKVTLEIAERVKKAALTQSEGLAAEAKLVKALKDNENFTARDGVKVYEPADFELPSVLRDLTARLQATTKQYRAAQQQMQPGLARVQELLDLASKAKSLPGGAAGEIALLETQANDLSKNFGKWNKEINNPWKPASAKARSLKKDDHLETVELLWRGEKLYDEFSVAFGEADETAKNVLHGVRLLNSAIAGAPASPAEANQEVDKWIAAMNKLREVVTDPIGRLNDAKRGAADRKKQFAAVDATQVPALEGALTEMNQDIEKARANLRSLERAAQEAGLVEGLIKTRFSAKGVDKKKVDSLKKASSAVDKAISPALKEAEKTIAALVALREELARKRAALGKAAAVEDTVRLTAALKELPPLQDKAALFPAKGVAKWKNATSKGGDKKAARLFAEVTKAWEAAEKSADNSSLTSLENAAAAFLTHFAELSQAGAPEAADATRADKCREAQALARKMRLKNDLDSLPEPPWTEEQATKAKRIEACSLLESGTPAKAPSAKGESDSFFIKNASGKPAFIFKPKQGENVKEDFGGREGEGVVREVLSSKFNDQIKEMTGVDFGVCPTQIARLESDSFANGEKSKEKSRVGALQQAVANEGSLLDKLVEDPAFARQVKTEDVQKVALMDFLTLQADRNAGNLLVQEVDGEKRLVPIDGGFAFPKAELFGKASGGMASERMDFSGPPPADENGKLKARGGLEGKNALMILPQSEERFSPEMLQSIEAIDPAALAKGLKQSSAEIGESAPELNGLVDDENVENVRRSALFLKKAAPHFTVAELAEIYALDFTRVLAVPAGKVEKEIAAVIAQGRARADFNRTKKEADAEYARLGGDAELVKLGWDPKTDRLLRLNGKRRIEILKKREQAPPAPAAQPAPPKPASDQAALERELKTLGGDKEWAVVQKRPDNSPKITGNATLVAKVGRLRLWRQFKDEGGDKAFDKLVELFQKSQYTPFDQLNKAGQASVAAFASWSGDPYALGIGGKADALKDFNKFKK